MRNVILSVTLFLVCFSHAYGSEVDLVLVKKSDRKMYLISQDRIIKKYNVALGRNPRGHKRQQGDGRTPEGRYVLDYKKSDSAFYKAIHISYPNREDRKSARQQGVDPGGRIMIHGQKNGGPEWLSLISEEVNWTDGCIAVTNKEMDEIWRLVNVGTPIEIRP